MDVMKFRDRFQLHDNSIFDEEIQFVCANEVTAIVNGNLDLLLKTKADAFKFNHIAFS